MRLLPPSSIFLQEERKLPAVAVASLTLALLHAGLTIAVSGHVGSGRLALGGIPVVIERDSLAVVQRLEATGIDGGKVDKDVLTTVSRADESEALLGIEKLNSSVTGHD